MIITFVVIRRSHACDTLGGCEVHNASLIKSLGSLRVLVQVSLKRRNIRHIELEIISRLSLLVVWQESDSQSFSHLTHQWNHSVGPCRTCGLLEVAICCSLETTAELKDQRIETDGSTDTLLRFATNLIERHLGWFVANLLDFEWPSHYQDRTSGITCEVLL